MNTSPQTTTLDGFLIDIHRSRGRISIQDYVKEMSTRAIIPANPIAVLISIQRLIANGKLPEEAYVPTELPKPLEESEIRALHFVIKETKEKQERLTFEEIAERTIIQSKSLRPLDAMIQKIRFLLMPLRFDDETDFEDDDENPTDDQSSD